ncbi:hypothetical protein RHGRI_020004 [Rhododendron griersonianum]|uniref:Uncharacterized protein n=1 Tax=Rhododendron griersonianum TaxID=479676 RepID=A0AAV6JEW7_9ERIC|nr:hypothetical protein RHGRI_020004 [Rhododendron griersonianum]
MVFTYCPVHIVLIYRTMVVRVPFRRWVHVKHRNPETPHGGFYCLEGDPLKIDQVLTVIGIFFICSIAVGMVIEIIVMYPIQHRDYRPGIDSLQGAITKRMTAIEEMAGMDVLCSDKTRTLTLNKLTVDKSLIGVFARGVYADTVVLMATRASRVENKDAIDTPIVGTLADPKEARAGIQEVHFLPFNPTDRQTALAYIDSEGKMHRILNIAHNKSKIERRVHAVIDKFAETFFVYARISQLKLNVHTVSADNSTETTNHSEALLALPSNTPNKKSKKGDHNSSTSTSGPAIDTPANSSPTTNSPTTEETQDSHNKNK